MIREIVDLQIYCAGSLSKANTL